MYFETRIKLASGSVTGKPFYVGMGSISCYNLQIHVYKHFPSLNALIYRLVSMVIEKVCPVYSIVDYVQKGARWERKNSHVDTQSLTF